ncbi:unnamed protein product [Ectocarpus sp. 12 AP-2014]
MPPTLTCTACAITFSTSDAHKTHYKLDWHRYNLRRKVAGLAPVDQSDFDRRLAAALGSDAPKENFQARCTECRKSFRSEGLYKQHLQSKKHKEAAKRVAAVAKPAATAASLRDDASGGAAASSEPADAGNNDDEAVALQESGNGTSGAGASSAVAAAALPSESRCRGSGSPEKGAMSEEEEKEEEREEEELVPPPMGPCVCIFCDLVSPSFEENFAHMLRQHGFFIPDVEYLQDPEGLIAYVEEKVKLGFICLYCNGKGKTFHTYRAVQQHMIDRAHCKLLYDEDEDLHEYESFYDFSASYLDAEKSGLLAANASGTGDAATAAAAENSGEESDGETVEVSRTLGVTDLGELVLLDGKTVGNRKWNRYYKQRLRTPDERDVVVAQRRAARLRLGAMYDDEMSKGTSTGGAVALQRGERKAFGGLSGVSRSKDVKMLRAHQRSQARERLKTEIRQNKLNKTFDRVSDM